MVCESTDLRRQFKTDPKNTDYAAEHGASRNFEPWREVTIVEEEDRLAKLTPCKIFVREMHGMSVWREVVLPMKHWMRE